MSIAVAMIGSYGRVRRLLAASIVGATLVGGTGAGAQDPATAVAEGQVLPPAIKSLVVGTRDGRIRLTGRLELDGRVVLFETVRGAAVHPAERLSGGPSHEIDVCVTDEHGRPLWFSSGGDADLISACNPEHRADSEADRGSRRAEYRLVAHALRTLGQVRFDARFEAEQRRLTGEAGLAEALSEADVANSPPAVASPSRLDGR